MCAKCFYRGRQTKIIVPKKEKSWWARLTPVKLANVKIDWATWKDENEGGFNYLI